ncbi:MAG: hypothetical protein JWL92_582 [Candidatus Nomurabacteria bacterium]|nr:hypothetical protein [Candidatus Nomurabacteria bacterium]
MKKSLTIPRLLVAIAVLLVLGAFKIYSNATEVPITYNEKGKLYDFTLKINVTDSLDLINYENVKTDSIIIVVLARRKHGNRAHKSVQWLMADSHYTPDASFAVIKTYEAKIVGIKEHPH